MEFVDNLGYVGEIQKKLNELEVSIKALRKTGTDYALAEKNYKIQLRQTALELRSQDMAIGMIDKTIYGDPKVAELRFKRDVAEALYKANQEHINATKLEIRILESQLSREYGATISD